MIIEFLLSTAVFTFARGLTNSNVGKKVIGRISEGLDGLFGYYSKDNNLSMSDNIKQREYMYPSEEQFRKNYEDAIEVEYKEIVSNHNIEQINHFEKGNEYAKDNEYAKAIEEFENHIKIFPEQAGAYIQIAFCYRYLGNIDKAIDYIQKALVFKSDILNGYSMLGKFYNEKGDYTKAIEALIKGVENNPTTAAYYELAKAYFNKGSCSELTIKYCDKSLELDSNDFEALILKATVYIEDGKFDIAIELMNSALENNGIVEKVQYSILLVLCSIYIIIGEYEKAVKECEKALAIDSKSPMAYIYRSICHIAKAEYELASKIITKLDLKNELTYVCNGYIKIGTGNPQGAIEDFKEAEKLNERNAEIYNGLYIAYTMLNQAGAAEINLEKALRYKIKGQNFLPIKGVELKDIPKTYADKYNIEKYRYTAGTKFILHTAIDDEGKKVAIKELNDYFASQQLFVTLFKKEIDIIKNLKHKNIIDILDYGINRYNQRYFIVMPLMKCNLKEYIERVTITEKEIVEITLQILEGLKYCHNFTMPDDKGGIIHRELKPTEVLLDYDGTVKISDFANAKATATFTSQAGASVSRADSDVLYFIAPERLQGTKADIRADIYSVGALMYYMATGTYPFYSEQKENNAQRLLRIMKEPIIISEQNSILENPELIKIIIKAMDKNRENRYQTDDEMINEIKKIKI